MGESDILQQIVDFYIKSHDFNGIPYDDLRGKHTSRGSLERSMINLIRKDKVALNYTNNPHIKQFDDPPIED